MNLLRTLCLILLATTLATAADHGKYLFFVGTYTVDGGKSTGSKGIYADSYDSGTGQIGELGLAAETTNPSWIAISPNGRFLYAVNEVGDYNGPNSGGVSAFAIDRDSNGHPTGKLTFLNEVRSRGADPCYVTVDETGKWVLVANYTGGSVAVFPILNDGKLGEASDFVQHTGHGPNPQRQEGPHAHSIDVSRDNRFAFVDDLGLDALLSYRFDADKGKLTAVNTLASKLDPGAGPRHFALHPSGKFAYVLSEMRSTVTVFAADLPDGSFRPLQWTSTIPPDFKQPNDAAEIAVEPSGRFLYSSNRGQDTIIGFAIDQSKGTLSPLFYIPTGGKTPRSFAIDPTGTFLFAENQKSDNIVLFRIDPSTGRLTPTGKTINAPSPVCMKFLAAE